MLANPTFDADLLARYDRPGPRYTSYPTAPQFADGFGEEQLRAAVLASNGDPIPRRLSLYVHVPFCLSPCFYCGCNRIITRDKSRAGTYLARLYREIGLMAELFDRAREVIQVHLGGGTHNFLDGGQLQELLETMSSQLRFSRSPARDHSDELDPRFLSPADIAGMPAPGFKRDHIRVTTVEAAVPAVQSEARRVKGG